MFERGLNVNLRGELEECTCGIDLRNCGSPKKSIRYDQEYARDFSRPRSNEADPRFSLPNTQTKVSSFFYEKSRFSKLERFFRCQLFSCALPTKYFTLPKYFNPVSLVAVLIALDIAVM